MWPFRKKFLTECISPLFERTGGATKSPLRKTRTECREASEGTFQAAMRAGLKGPAGFAGTVKATAKPVAAVDLSHQTLAVRHGARPFAFRRSLPALPVSGVGLDDPACRGAAGGHIVVGSNISFDYFSSFYRFRFKYKKTIH